MVQMTGLKINNLVNKTEKPTEHNQQIIALRERTGTKLLIARLKIARIRSEETERF